MINEAPITTATSALGSIKLDKMVQTDGEVPVNSQLSTLNSQPSAPRIALLTGGGDKPYALGMAAALTSAGIDVDFIGSDDLKVPELLSNSRIHFRNLRGDQRPDVSRPAKALRILIYYAKLILYAATAKPKLFHILWNNKFQFLDCTVLMLYYRLLGKKLVFTAHNVNAGKRDSNDSWLNRALLKIQYSLCDQIFVHTTGMKSEMVADFRIPESRVSVIPFGINNTVSNTSLSSSEAKRQLDIRKEDKAVLFFGNIAPYKGLEYLVAAVAELLRKKRNYRLLIVGTPKGSKDYWNQIRQRIIGGGLDDRITEKIEYVPDREAELYFKAADVLVLPYAHVFQSGVLFLGYSFGLPAIAADVGSLKEEIIEGETGFVFTPRNASDLASKIDQYFKSELFRNLESRRAQIKQYANERYSWSKVAAIITEVYSKLLGVDSTIH
jgi:glycosyltransferase involved in cell wall biosynthesis